MVSILAGIRPCPVNLCYTYTYFGAIIRVSEIIYFLQQPDVSEYIMNLFVWLHICMKGIKNIFASQNRENIVFLKESQIFSEILYIGWLDSDLAASNICTSIRQYGTTSYFRTGSIKI